MKNTEKLMNNTGYFLNKERILAIVLIAVTLTLYWKTVSFEFINLDDNAYILMNDHVQNGFTWDSIKWAFTTYHAANWHPLTWLSHMLDFKLFGFASAGHHIMNVFIHLTNSLLLFFFFNIATGSTWRSFVVALIFAVHPLHVESVAWVSERKDVLSAFFWLLTMIFYIRFTREKNLWNYSAVFFSFLLGLLSKPMVVTLPFVLLLMDYWPLKRLEAADLKSVRKFIPFLAEKIPLIILSVVSCAITYIAQMRGGAMSYLDSLPLEYRLINAIISYMKYLGKMFYPVDLTFYYTHPGVNYSLISLIASIALISAVTIFIVLKSRKREFLASGWFWYLGTLIPVIGIIQVGRQAMADRYTYIPSIGIIFAAVWLISEVRYSPDKKKYVAGLTALVITIFSIMSWHQLESWRNSKNLFANAVVTNQDNYLALDFLGQEYLIEGQFDKALELCIRAIGKNPDFADTYNTMGLIYLMKDMNAEAMENFQKAVKLNPNYGQAYFNLAKVFINIKEFGRAAEILLKIEENMKVNSSNSNKLGLLWLEMGSTDKARSLFEAALKLKPADPETLNNIAVAFLKEGKFKEAREYLEKALYHDPYNKIILKNYEQALLAK
jgi:Flp pilus assembly protein TadD